MSPSPEGRKRQRTSDVDERDTKKLKSNEESKVNDSTDQNDNAKSKEWISEQMGKMEKLYKEVLIQAALIFQNQSFSKRLGMNQQKVPIHMMDRLETTWRSYEGLRRQIECCTANPTKSPPIISKPSSTLAAITKLASTSIPPKTMELPTPVNLSIGGDYIPLLTPKPSSTIELTSVTESKDIINDIEPMEIRMQDQTKDEDQDLSVNSQPNEVIKEDIKEEEQAILPSLETQSIPQPQTGLVEPPPPIQETIENQVIQQQQQEIQNQNQVQNQTQIPIDENGTMDYSTLGLDELNALINGNGFDNLSNSIDIPTNNITTNQQQQQQQQSQEILTSLGLNTGTGTGTQQISQPQQFTITIDQSQQNQDQNQNTNGPQQTQTSQQSQAQQQPQQQQIEFDFSQLSNNTGLDGDTDFSALAGLFANSTDPQPQTQLQSQPQISEQNNDVSLTINNFEGQMNNLEGQNTNVNKIEGLGNLLGNSGNNTNDNDANNQQGGNNVVQNNNLVQAQEQNQNQSQNQEVQKDQNQVQNQNQNQTQNQTQNQDNQSKNNNDLSSLLPFNQSSQELQPQPSTLAQPIANTSQTTNQPSSQPSAVASIPQQSQQNAAAQSTQQPPPQQQQQLPSVPSIPQPFQPNFDLPQPFQSNPQGGGEFDPLNPNGGTNEFGEIDMADFNFTDAGLEGMGVGGDEFERLMAEFE